MTTHLRWLSGVSIDTIAPLLGLAASLCLLPLTVRTGIERSPETAIAMVAEVGHGSKCNGKQMIPGQFIFPGQRITTGQSWVKLMTRDWGLIRLHSRQGWPPLNEPQKDPGAVEIFEGLVWGWEHRQEVMNAGSRNPHQPKPYDVILLGSEPLNPLKRGFGISLLFAAKPGCQDDVDLLLDSGAFLPIEGKKVLGRVGGHLIVVGHCEVRTDQWPNAGQLHVKVGYETVDDRSINIDEFPGLDKKIVRQYLAADRESPSPEKQAPAESLAFGYVFEAIRGDGSSISKLPVLPVHAMTRYLNAYEVAGNHPPQKEARRSAEIALYALLDLLDSPFEDYLRRDKPTIAPKKLVLGK